jgi:YVTN family beta-propeller protein
MGNARYVGRVGALAVALGVGAAIASTPGVALAEPAGSDASTSPSPDSESSASSPGSVSSSPSSDTTSASDSTSGSSSSSSASITSSSDPTTTVRSSGGAHTSSATSGTDTETADADTTTDDSRPANTDAEPAGAANGAENFTPLPVVDEEATSAPPAASGGEPARSTEVEVHRKKGPGGKATANASEDRAAQGTVDTRIDSRVPAVAALSEPAVDEAARPVDNASATASYVVTQASTVASQPVPAASPAPASAAAVVAAVLGLGPALSTTTTPAAPVDAPTLWAVAALGAARREIQQSLVEQSPSTNTVQTSQSLAINTGPVSPTAAASTNPVGDLLGGLLGGILHVLFNNPPTTDYDTGDNLQSAEGVITGTLNADDPDGDALTFTVTDAPEHGTVVVNAPDGSFTYTPEPGFAHLGGTDSFTVRIRDNHPSLLSPEGVITKTVSVTVTPVNHPPVAGDPAAPVVNPNNGVVTGTVNVTDQDGDTLSYALGTAPDPAKGTVVVDPTTGNWTYTPTFTARLKASDVNATPADQQVSFTISASDGQATTSVAVNTVVQPLAVTDINVGIYTQAGIAVSPDSNYVYVPRHAVDEEDEDVIAVIDTSTNTVVATIVVGADPRDVAVSPDGARVYVSGFFPSEVSVIDTATNTVIATIPVASGAPSQVAVSPDGSRVYVANLGGTMSVIDTATNTVTATIPLANSADEMAISPDGTRIYATHLFEDTVSVIDTASNTVTATISVSELPRSVAVSPDGSRAYVVGGFGDGNVSVIDTATNTVTTTISLGSSGEGVAFSPDGTYAYVTRFDDSVSVIDTASNTVIATIAVGSAPDAVAVSPDGTHVYVTNLFDGMVSVITLG